MVNSHGTIQAKARRANYRSPTLPTTCMRTTMLTVRQRTGMVTLRTGNNERQERSTHNISQSQFSKLMRNRPTMDRRSTALAKDADKTINLGYQTPGHLRDFWAIIIDTGAAISVCPTTVCEHIEVKPMGDETKKQYVTVTGEALTIHGWREVTILVGCISLQICFVVANVQSALLGLRDLNKNKVTFHTGATPYIEKVTAISGHKTWEQLQTRGAQIHASAIVLPGFYKPQNIHLDSCFKSRYNPSLPTTVLVGDIEDLSLAKPPTS
eukprot:2404787-Amphidinium_carterae.1